MERTLIIVKYRPVMRGIVEVLTRFERAGFKIVGVKMLAAPNYEQLHRHYGDHRSSGIAR